MAPSSRRGPGVIARDEADRIRMDVGALAVRTQVAGEDDAPRRKLRELGVGEPDEDAVRARARFEARDDRARQRPFFRVRAETDGHVATARIGGHVASIRKTADARVAAGAKVNRLAPRRLQRRRFRYVALCLDIPRDHRGKACREQHSHLYGLFLHFGCEGFIKPLSHRQQLSREPRSPPRRAGRRASCRAARGASPRSRREATPTRPESPVRRRSR